MALNRLLCITDTLYQPVVMSDLALKKSCQTLQQLGGVIVSRLNTALSRLRNID